MKRAICMITAILMSFMLTACGGGNVYNVEVIDWEPSEIYTDADIESAIQTVKNYFKQNFFGCTLTKIGYVGDTFADQFDKSAEQYNSDEAIILYSSFDVDSSGANVSLEPNYTYNNWRWTLTRNANGKWRHTDHGYA